MTQDQVLRFFLDRGIACRRGITNAHQEPAYAGRDNWRGGPLPVSEDLRAHTVMLPLFHGMTKDEERLVRDAIDELRDPAARAPYVSSRPVRTGTLTDRYGVRSRYAPACPGFSVSLRRLCLVPRERRSRMTRNIGSLR